MSKRTDFLNFLGAGILGANIASVDAPARDELSETRVCQSIADVGDRVIVSGQADAARGIAEILDTILCTPNTPINPYIMKEEAAWEGAAVGEAIMGAIYLAMSWRGRRKDQRPKRI